MTERTFLQKPWLYIALCLATYLFGGLFQPGEWYATINRAPWTPPNLAFPIVWTALYVLIAWAGYLAAKSEDRQLLRLWFAQLALNAAWSWLFFGQHWVVLALIDLVLVVLLVACFVVRGYRIKQTLVSNLFLPYLAWLALATSLNAYIVIYN